MQITITLSDLDAAVFSRIAGDPGEWARNAVASRVTHEKEALADAEARTRRDLGEPPLATFDELVAAALERGGMPNPPLPPRVPVVIAMAELAVEGEELTGFETAAGIGFGMALDVGTYWLFFAQPEADTLYVPIVQAPGFNADVTLREVDFFEVTVSNRATGEPTIPARLLVTVQRVK